MNCFRLIVLCCGPLRLAATLAVTSPVSLEAFDGGKVDFCQATGTGTWDLDLGLGTWDLGLGSWVLGLGTGTWDLGKWNREYPSPRR